MIKKRYAGGAKYPLCLAMFLLLCASLQAQEEEKAPVKVTLDEAVNLAIKNNLSLESSRTSLSTRKRASDLSWNQFIPTMDVGGAILHLNEKPQAMVLPMSQFMPGAPDIQLGGGGSQWRVAGSITISLSFNMAMIEEMKKLRLDYEKGLISFDKAKQQLERDVRKMYHNMLLLQENIALMRGSYANVERQVQMAQANYNAGLAPELTLLQARVARENMRPVIDQAENGMKLSMAQFAMYLGLNYETAFELTPLNENDIFIPLDVAEIISKASNGKPEIMELRQDILSLRTIRKSTMYRLYSPTLSLSWNADPTFAGDPWKDAWFEDMDKWKQQSGSFRISLGFRLNGLLPFGSERQGFKSIDDQIKIATIGLAQLVNGTEIEVYNTVLSLEKTRANTKAQEETVRLAEQSYRLTEEAYRAGLQDYFQVQNAEQSLRQARVQLLEQHFNYLNGLIDLEYSLGVPFGTLSERSK
jgi:outer membrane protein TolC